MSPNTKALIYATSVFFVYIVLTYILRISFGKMPLDAAYLGVYTNNDLLVGVAISAVLTFTHIQKNKKINEKK
jgi:hypothetical protein